VRALAGPAAQLAPAGFLALLLAAPGAHAGDPQVRPGEWNPDKAPPGWVVVQTRNYQVQSEVGEAKGRLLAEHLEGMLDLYRELLPFTKRMPTFVLKIFEDEAGYRAYGGEAVAHYDKAAKELVCWDTGIVLGVRDVPASVRLGPDSGLTPSEAERARLDQLFEAITDDYTMDLARVLSHEGWHQYFHYYTVSWVAMPSWLDEGMGDYFFTAERTEDGQGYHLGALNHGRLRTLRRAFEEGTTVSFARLLDFEQGDYYSNASVYYAQGWSMVHFLMQNEDPALRQLIPKLIADFKRSKNFREATAKAFDRRSLDSLDSEWIAWVLRQEPRDPLRELAREFGERIRAEDLVAPERWKERYTLLLEEERAAAAKATGKPPERAPPGGR